MIKGRCASASTLCAAASAAAAGAGVPLVRAKRSGRSAVGSPQQVEGDFQVRRARPRGVQRGKGGPQMVAYVLGTAGTARQPADPGGERALILQFVQYPPALAERGAYRAARDHQQRHRVGIGLGNRREGVRDPGAGDHEGRGGAAAEARVTVGGESGVLFMTHQQVPQPRGFQAAIQLNVVHARNAEHRVDAVGGERLDHVTADGPGQGTHVLEMLTLPTHSKNVKFSPLVQRISGDGADAWLTHYLAVAARDAW